MDAGVVLQIQIAPVKRGPTVPLPEVRAVAGQGLEGDHHFRADGVFDDRVGPGRQVTLVDADEVEAANVAHGFGLAPVDLRRNLVTRGVRLLDLLDREFLVGEAVLRGERRSDPCAHIESVTKPGVLAAFVGRAGLRASVVRSGTIRVGDRVSRTGS
ncbi:MAG TPA: MOSC domain-containing protein [Candidatus Thermoplasmatota archaeon]|nr:MOSC domain-containing protein [Candidatus Thermoplasmatota archaeon]